MNLNPGSYAPEWLTYFLKSSDLKIFFIYSQLTAFGTKIFGEEKVLEKKSLRRRSTEV